MRSPGYLVTRVTWVTRVRRQDSDFSFLKLMWEVQVTWLLGLLAYQDEILTFSFSKLIWEVQVNWLLGLLRLLGLQDEILIFLF